MTPNLDELRGLDAASPTLSADEQQRAATMLERIVDTAPQQQPQPAAPAPPRRLRRRMVVGVTGTVMLGTAWIALQGVGGHDAAYAAWTADPGIVADQDRQAAETVCRRRMRTASIDRVQANLVLAERRGDHLVLLFRTDDPDMSEACLVHRPEGSTRTRVVGSAGGGSSGPALAAPPQGFTQGGITTFHEDGAVSVTDGAVGDEVVGVTIHAGDLEVHASVDDGRYVAWWPGRALEDVRPDVDSGFGGPEPILTYDLTLADGTVIRDADPTLPQ